MSTDIPISFEFKGRPYTGHLSLVFGAGANIWHMMLLKGGKTFYYGRLRCVRGEWVYDTNAGSIGWEVMADYFGSFVIAWTDSQPAP